MTLYNAKYEELGSLDATGNLSKSSFPKIGLPKGTYYIKVQSSYYSEAASTDRYGVYVSYKKSNMWEREFNNSYTTATKMQFGKWYYGTTLRGYSYEQDFFTFTVKNPKTYSIRINTKPQKTSNYYWTVVLYNKTYDKLQEINIPGNKTSTVLSHRLSKGKYYVLVRSYYYSDAESTDYYKLMVK